MLTAQVAFARDTTSDTLAAILEREPSWAALPARTPARLRDLLRLCLEKDVKRRLRDIGDARFDVDQNSVESSVVTTKTNPPVWIAIALGGVFAGLIAGWLVASPAKTGRVPEIGHLMLDVRPATALL